MASPTPRTGFPTWWPTALSTIGIALVIFVVIMRIFIPGFDFPSLLYPVIGLMVGGGPAVLGDRILRKQNGDS